MSAQADYCSEIVRNSSDLICCCDPSLGLVFANPAMIDFFALDPHAVAGRCLREFVLTKDAPVFLDAVTRLRNGMTHAFCELRMVDRNGSPRWLLWQFSRTRDPEGRIVTIQATGHSIASQHKQIASRRKYDARLQALTAQFQFAEEKERRRLAEAMHDTIAQHLAVASMSLQMHEQYPDDPRNLQAVKELLKQSLAEARSLTFQLSPPSLYSVGLEAAIEELLDHISRTHGIQTRIMNTPPLDPLPQPVAILLFRIVRELTMNTIKHAKASHLDVTLSREQERAVVLVEDDGIGFDVSGASNGSGFGLFSIRESLLNFEGAIRIDSSPGNGTRVHVTVGLAGHVQHDQQGEETQPATE